MAGPYRALAGLSPAEVERQVSLRIEAVIDARARARTQTERRRRVRHRLRRLAYLTWLPAAAALAWALYLGGQPRTSGWTALLSLITWLTVVSCTAGGRPRG